MFNTAVSEIDTISEVVTEVYMDWLRAEVESSHVERNKILDDYDDAIEGLKGGWDHPKNFSARKVEGHIDRLGPWFEAFTMAEDDDYQAARIIFAGLMQVSGSYRNQSYVEAQNSSDYLAMRQNVIGINLENAVSTRLRTFLPSTANFSSARITLEDLNRRRQEAEAIGLRAVKAMCVRVVLGLDLHKKDSRAAREAQNAQYNWATFTTDALTYVAKKRGSIADVPFLEPRSITDQSGTIRYPFKETINWTEVLAA